MAEAEGEGANWDILPDSVRPKGTSRVNMEVSVENSSPQTGVVQILIGENDSPAQIAAKHAHTWNEQRQIKDVVAVPEGNLAAFFLIGGLANGRITGMAATFPGQPRMEMSPPDPEYGSWVLWETAGVRVRRKKLVLS